MEEVLDSKKLDEVIEYTLSSIEKGKKDIFDISETARNEVKRVEEDLDTIKKETREIIKQLEVLEEQLAKSKHRLMYVNKNFEKFSEKDLKEAYENADKNLVEVAVLREKEKNMIQRRNDMEIRYKNSLSIVDKADKLISQVSVVFDYLSGSLKGITDKIEGVQQKYGMGVRVIRAQEEERHRVAREIHDGPAQLMANVVLKAEICEKLIDIDILKTKEELNNLKKVVRDSLQDVRRIIYDLRPMSLDDLGLAPTVKRYVNTFSEDTDINVKVEIFGDLDDLKSVISLTAFRIIQESLNNIKKHSKASDVKIKIENRLGKITVIISDNGVGFDINNIKKDSGDMQSGFGLYSMHERLELLNGTIDIKSEIGKGTKVSIVIPTDIEEGV